MSILLAGLLLAGSASFDSPSHVVESFYGAVIKHHPLGIPTDLAKRDLWPHLSASLAHRLEALAACEEDYYRQNRTRLESEQLKAAIGWLESGLFSGDSEKALPAEARVLRVDRLPGRSSVRIRFTYRDTFETYGRPPDDSNTFSWLGVVTVVREDGQYKISDYTPLDDDTAKELTPLSQDFRECDGSRWVGHKGQDY